MIGPLAETQAAAAFYRDELGWPVGSVSRAVWICLNRHAAALAIPEPLATILDLPGPAVFCPGTPSYRVHLTAAPTLHDHDAAPVLSTYGVLHLGYPCLLDLPPTPTPNGPVTWAVVPTREPGLPSFASIVRALRRYRRAGLMRRSDRGPVV